MTDRTNRRLPTRRSARGLLGGAVLGAALVATVVACSVDPTRTTPGRPAAPPAGTGPAAAAGLALSVADNGRYLVDVAGEPFFWLADTAWSLPLNLDRDEVVEYLDTRAEQGYNVIQTVAVFNQAGGPGPNRYGDDPYRDDLEPVVTEGSDPDDDEQYDYWDHLDYIVAEAEARDLRVALLPAWGDDQAGEVVREDNAGAFGEFLGARYGEAELVWVMGGDASADGVEDVWRELARGVAVGATGREDYSTTMMTYHPQGDLSSAKWFHDDDWLDFNMVQGGHCLRYDARRDIIATTYDEDPVKPFLDGEPIYEEHPYCWDDAPEGYSTPQDVRRDAYWSVFAGAAGHSYGHHTVWQFLGDDRSPVLGARGEWRGALDDEAAGQMRHVRALMESRPFTTGLPDQELVTGGDRGTERVVATRSEDGAYVMAYSPDGAPFDADLSVLAGDQARTWWFDPRTGQAQDAGTVEAGTTVFTPPSDDDWVLVADDPAAGFGAPGA